MQRRAACPISCLHSRPMKRASLAVFCYHKSHLRRIGLAIARTCDLTSLVQEWGVILGQAVFSQSRERFEETGRMGVRPRPKITLARSVGRHYPPPIDLDEITHPTCSVPTECVELLGAT